MATKKKAIPFRYHPELEKDIQTISEVADYANRKNKGITYAVKLAAAYVRDLMKMKKIKSIYDAQKYIDEKYQINRYEL